MKKIEIKLFVGPYDAVPVENTFIEQSELNDRIKGFVRQSYPYLVEAVNSLNVPIEDCYGNYFGRDIFRRVEKNKDKIHRLIITQQVEEFYGI